MKKATERITRKSCQRRFYKGNHLNFGLGVVAAILMGAVNLEASWLIQQLIDTITVSPDTPGLQTLMGLAAGLVVSVLLIGAMTCVVKPRFVKRAMLGYKEYAFDALLRRNINTFQKETTATYLSALSYDVNSIERNYLEKQFELVCSAVMFFGAFGMMLFYSPLLTLIVVLLLIVPIVVSAVVGNRLEEAELEVSERNKSFTDTVKECVSGFSVIKSFQAEKAVFELFLKNNKRVEDAKCRRRRVGIAVETISVAAGLLTQIGVFIAGAYLTISGKGVTPGIVMAFVNLMNLILQPIAVLPELLANRKAAVALMDKLCTSLNETTESQREGELFGVTQGIRMEHVSFSYGEGEPVVEDVCLTFDAGKRYALVGASGSGKSTLLNLLLAGHDTYDGSVTYDGQELRKISTESLYDTVSVIQQNVVIFNASVRDNITMFGDASKEEVDRVIELAGLSEFVKEHGEDYLCGENGNALSGGERQRISIARSLLRKASVLLVDEATAALDKQTAYQVTEGILGIEGITGIVVTHALEESLLRRFDEIIVLKAGKVVEKGNFEKLMEKKEYFYSLYTVAQ